MSQLRALVTGASSGVGMATARLVHARGGSVALVARREDVLAGLAAELGDRAYAFPCDVSDPAAVAAHGRGRDTDARAAWTWWSPRPAWTARPPSRR